MPVLALVLLLLAASAALNVLARRLDVPHPVMLVLGGLLLAITPGLPRARLDPDIVFLVFVPPLVYRAAILTSWRDFRAHLRTILLLAVGLVIATIAATAAVSHALVDGLPWSAAFVLGAIVAPSDPVAATAVISRLETPRSIDTILEGEGLVNDATALVAYRMAVEATTTGVFHPSSAALRFVFASAGGVAIGIAVGAGVAFVRRHLKHVPDVENTISLLTPFAAFISADRVGASGVLAVVAAGLYLGHESPRLISPETRLQASGVWNTATFMFEGVIFILIGLDLPLVTADLPPGSLHHFVVYGVVVSAAAIAIRLAWMFPGAYLPRRIDAWLGRNPDYPAWRDVFFVGWAGMRGADSLVIALALPLTIAGGRPFPGRSAIIFVTFVVILITLVLQGLTLTPLIRRLHLARDSATDREEVLARLRTANAALARLDEAVRRDRSLASAAGELRERYRHRVHRYESRRRNARHAPDEAYLDAFRRARAEMIDAERRELVRLRDAGTIGDDVLRRVQRELDLEQLLIGGRDEALVDAEAPSDG